MRIHARGRGSALITALAAGLVIAAPGLSTQANALATQAVENAPSDAFELFLDRLMAAESGGRSTAKNPRSTALGPYQFIKSTFLELAHRHFPGEIAGLTEEQILRLRTDGDLSRRAAAIFCRESVSYLRERGLEPTFAHLRLAYLLGPADAARIMQADAQTPIPRLLSAAVVKANPFMRRMRVADLLGKSERDVSRERSEPLRATGAQDSVRPPARARPKATSRQALGRATPTRCNKRLPSCRKYLTARASRGA